MGTGRDVGRIGGAFLVGAVGLLFTSMSLHEWWRISVQRDPELVRQYPFAAENVLGDGGWNYANPEIYGAWALGSAAFVVGASGLLVAALLRRSWWFAATSAIVWIAFWGTSEVLNNVEWERRPYLKGPANGPASMCVPSNGTLQLPKPCEGQVGTEVSLGDSDRVVVSAVSADGLRS